MCVAGLLVDSFLRAPASARNGDSLHGLLCSVVFGFLNAALGASERREQLKANYHLRSVISILCIMFGCSHVVLQKSQNL